MDSIDKFEQITVGQDKLAEVISVSELRACLNKTNPTSLWGINPKVLHFGYDRLVLKQKDMVAAGFKHTILLADKNILIEKGESSYLRKQADYVKYYFEEICGLQNVTYTYLSDVLKSDNYWELFSIISSKLKISDLNKLDVLKEGSIGNYLVAAFQLMDYLVLNKDVVFGGFGTKVLI